MDTSCCNDQDCVETVILLQFCGKIGNVDLSCFFCKFIWTLQLYTEWYCSHSDVWTLTRYAIKWSPPKSPSCYRRCWKYSHVNNPYNPFKESHLCGLLSFGRYGQGHFAFSLDFYRTSKKSIGKEHIENVCPVCSIYGTSIYCIYTESIVYFNAFLTILCILFSPS